MGEEVGDGGDSIKCSPSTVIVKNIPYTFNQTQLEKEFSDVGPIRRCFTVNKKGSNEHRGFGFVQFAVTVDASRAIKLKNGASIGRRKLSVQSARPRPTLKQRRLKESQVVQSDDITKTKNERNLIPLDAVKAKEITDSLETGVSSEFVKEPPPVKNIKDEGSGSKKQRVARTVIFGGLLDAKMAESVHLIARDCGTVLAINYPLPKEELEHHGLGREGCKVDASSVLFTRVKSARDCVTKLHQKKINGRVVWARQLGGEVTVDEIRILFSLAGFVWDAYFPPHSNAGSENGFAFVQFTSKHDAENAIEKFNGQKIGGRTIAVDWAVPKNIYVMGALSAVSSDDGEKSGNEIYDNRDSEDKKDSDADIDAVTEVDPTSNDAGITEEEDDSATVDFDKEADVARNISQNLISSSSKGNTVSLHDAAIDLVSKASAECAKIAGALKPGNSEETKLTKSEVIEVEEELQRTIFIKNLPFDVDREVVKQRFSAFGEIQSYIPTVDNVSKRPTGTGFLKFKTIDGKNAALLAAGLGISVKGRPVQLFRALDKKSAHTKKQENAKKEVHDHRNLYLAKEGLIVEGTSAAEGVSASDLLKRQELDRKKETKLKSPNFHVSRTRLVMYNLPKSMTENELKKLCIEAVTSRAKKQKPVLRQIKLLKDTKKRKPVKNNFSRGVAFLEFAEHQHALVALRVLNNNPKVFGSEHRPILEFALDNVQILKLRDNRIHKQQQGPPGDTENPHQSNDRTAPDAYQIEKPRTRMFKGDNAPLRDHKTDRKEKVGNYVPSGKRNLGMHKGIDNRGEHKLRDNRGERKLRDDQDGCKLGNDQGERKLRDNQDGCKLGNNQGELKFQDHKSVQVPNAGISGPIEKGNRRGEKRKLQNRNENDVEGISLTKGRNLKKKKALSGGDVVDKLDMLIEKYRNRFSHNGSDKTDGQKQGSSQLRKWFESK